MSGKIEGSTLVSILPKPHPNETDQYIKTETLLLYLKIKQFKQLSKITNQLTLHYNKPPLIPEFLIQHFNQLSSSFAFTNNQSITISSKLSLHAQLLNIRYDFLCKYEEQCKNTQKSLLSLQKLKQKTNLDNRRVDEHLADLQFLKSLEQETREELALESLRAKRGIRKFREEYEMAVDEMLGDLVEKQLYSHKMLIERLEHSLA